jgi:hypothetical protein
MPSPFPGMDPYLEGPLWSTVHSQLVPEIARQLAPKLRPKYLALTTEYFLLAVVDGRGRSAGAADTATMVAAPLTLEMVVPVRVPMVAVEIRETRTRRLVTAIELLSPANKRGSGRRQYLNRRHRLFLTSAHLVEVDLLRRGKRVPMRHPLPDKPYFVFISRASRRPMADVWPIELAQPLPEVSIPLLPGDDEVPLDLQLALTTVYDLVGYDLAIDYSSDPPPPLSLEQTTWIDARLRAVGLRT